MDIVEEIPGSHDWTTYKVFMIALAVFCWLFYSNQKFT